MPLKFQTALITCSSGGFGTLFLIEEAGASGVPLQGDVAGAMAAEKLVKEAAQKLGGYGFFGDL